MANTYTLIQGYTLTSNAAGAITFSSIPQTFEHLVLRVSARSLDASVISDIKILINGNTSATYSNNRLYAVGNPVSTGQDGGNAANTTWTYFGALTGNNATSTIFSGQEIFLPKYTSSTTKNGNGSSTSTNNGLSSDNWYSQYNTIKTSDTNPITSISLTSNSNAYLMNKSTIFLYGLASS
jgi:hypothetical protein